MAASARALRIRVRAYAKINLALQVVGVRPDGYHELRTTFQTIALHDTLTLVKRSGPFEIRCTDPRCPVDETNLVWRAAERVWHAGGRRGAPEGVRVHIEKRIPVEAGLGGGSSDAAASLAGLAKLWRVRLDAARLRRIARALGADVPFFLEGGTALGTGRGDRLRRLPDAPASWVALVLPNFGVSTKDAYTWWDARTPEAGNLRSSPSGERQHVRATNDLQPPVAARHPEISEIVALLERAGAARAAMSGSGSAVFGLFEIRRQAGRAVRSLAVKGWRTLLTRTLDGSTARKSA